MTTAQLDPPAKAATLDDLLRVEGKAELVGGRIIKMMPVSDLPGEVALNIALLLKEFVRTAKRGHVRGDAVAFAAPRLSSGRQFFAPDASYYEGPLPENRMRFIPGPPRFAAEVSSENS